MQSPADDITRWLKGAALGDKDDARQLMERVYKELHAMAAAQMSWERDDHSMQATALVNEAYLRLIGQGELAKENRRSFFAAAAEAMRRILIEHARHKGRRKRGGDWRRLALEDVLSMPEKNLDDFLAVDEALRRLKELDPRAAEVVQLRFYAGLGFKEIAMTLDSSERTVMREWAFARTWLYSQLADEQE